jgi:hypothetical protein
MPNLKDVMSEDIGTLFFNSDEFAEIVEINGRVQKVIIDDDRLQKRSAAEYSGLATGLILYFIPVAALPSKPAIGDTQIFNKRYMFVDDVKESGGVYEIILTQNRGE